MKFAWLEVNVRTIDGLGIIVPRVHLEIHNWDTLDVKPMITDANGRGQVLMHPCNSLNVRWRDPATGIWTSQRVHTQYSIRRPGTPHNHKKLDLDLVVGRSGPPDDIWYAMSSYAPI